MENQQNPLVYVPVRTGWPEVYYTQWPDGTWRAGYQGPPAPLLWFAAGGVLGAGIALYLRQRYS